MAQWQSSIKFKHLVLELVIPVASFPTGLRQLTLQSRSGVFVTNILFTLNGSRNCIMANPSVLAFTAYVNSDNTVSYNRSYTNNLILLLFILLL